MYRRLRKVPHAPIFLLPGHLLTASVGHRIQGDGPISCSGNTAVLEMLKEEEVQGWELPLAVTIFRQGNSGCLTFQRAGSIIRHEQAEACRAV